MVSDPAPPAMLASASQAFLSPETRFALSARPLERGKVRPAVPAYRGGWVILDRFVRRRDEGSFPADNPTAAFETNSRGDRFGVCLNLDAPPRPSHFLMWWPDGPTGGEPLQPIAAHDGMVLLLMQYTIPVLGGRFRFPMIDFFVYSATISGPSLSRLPPLGGTIEEVQARVESEGIRTSNQILRRMNFKFMDMGLIFLSLRQRAAAEFMVDVTDMVARPQIRIFYPLVTNHWVLREPRVIPVSGKDDLDMDHILWYWETDAVVPWGNFLCWVDYSVGIMLCNVFDVDPDLLFLELPARQHCLNRKDDIVKGNMNAYHTLGTTGMGSVLKFAFVLWDDAIVKQKQDPDSSKFTVTTWKLRVEGTNMSWVEDSRFAADDLWVQDDFALIPCDLLLYPIFNEIDPNEVSFVLKHESAEQEDGAYNSSQISMVSIDMVKKKLKSSILYVQGPENSSPEGAELFERKNQYLEAFLPVRASKGLSQQANSWKERHHVATAIRMHGCI